jgi:hypothetical protein
MPRHLLARGLPARREAAQQRLAQLGGQRRELAVLLNRGVGVAELEEVVDAPVQALDAELDVADARREVEDLGADAQALLEVLDV